MGVGCLARAGHEGWTDSQPPLAKVYYRRSRQEEVGIYLIYFGHDSTPREKPSSPRDHGRASRSEFGDCAFLPLGRAAQVNRIIAHPAIIGSMEYLSEYEARMNVPGLILVDSGNWQDARVPTEYARSAGNRGHAISFSSRARKRITSLGFLK